MPLTKTRLAALAALCLCSTAASAAGLPAAPAMTAGAPMPLAQAGAIIRQNGFVPVGAPKQKGNIIGSLARLGDKAFIVTIDAQTGQLLDIKPTTMALPPMAAPVAGSAAAPVNVSVSVVNTPAPTPLQAAPLRRAAPVRHYVPSYAPGRRIAAKPPRPIRRRLPSISLASLPRPSGFNKVLGPVYRSPTDGYFIIDPTLGAVALDPGLFNAALAVQQGLLDPSAIGPGYSFNSGYQLGYQNGLNDATIGQLQQPLFFDPNQGPVFANPVTGQPTVYAPPQAPGLPSQPMPYLPPVWAEPTSPDGVPAPQQLGNLPGPAPGGSTPALPAVSEADQQAAQARINANPAIGNGHPIGGQQLDDIGTAMGVPMPPGGYTEEQRQNFQEIASHLTRPDPQALQNTAVNQAIEANPEAVNTKALDSVAAKDPAALDPAAIAAVAASQPGMVNPVTLNEVMQANPQDVSAEAIRQAAEANPGAITSVTINDEPGLDATGIATAPDSVQQQVQDQLNQAAETIGAPPADAQLMQPGQDMAAPGMQPAPDAMAPMASPAQATPDAAPTDAAAAGGQGDRQPFMSFSTGDFMQPDGTMPTDAAPGMQMSPDAMAPATPPTDTAAADGQADQQPFMSFSTDDFMQPDGTMDMTPALPTAMAAPDANAATDPNADMGFGAQDFMGQSMAPAPQEQAPPPDMAQDQAPQDRNGPDLAPQAQPAAPDMVPAPQQEAPQDNFDNGAQMDTAPQDNFQMDNGGSGGGDFGGDAGGGDGGSGGSD